MFGVKLLCIDLNCIQNPIDQTILTQKHLEQISRYLDIMEQEYQASLKEVPKVSSKVAAMFKGLGIP